jgi:hypothetical protein
MLRGTETGFVGGAVCPCSNIFTREVVGGIGVSSVGRWSCIGGRAAFATDCELKLSLLFGGGCLVSMRASMFPTLPEGGSTSLSLACRSLVMDALAWGVGRRGLWRAAASRAAMFDGDEPRSR